MNLQQLRYLVATADHGTMTRAAAAMQVSQPALTRSVRALEQELGVPLMERVGRGVRLTPAGRECVESARRVLSELTAIESLGTIAACRIATTETQGSELCAPAASRVVAGGDVPVVLTTADSAAEVVRLVSGGRADVGVCDLPVASSVRTTVLGWQEVLLLCPAKWDLKDPLPQQELGSIPLVVPAAGSRRRDEFDRGLGASGIRPAAVVETDRLEHGVPLVVAGVAATFTYRRAAAASISERVRVVRLDPPVRRQVGYIRRPGRQSESAQRFVRALRAEAADALDAIS
jgi:DNA-binding transcriptional LysR family regulator